MCDEKSKEFRISADNKATRNNMRHCGEQVIIERGHIASFPVKKTSQISGRRGRRE